MTKRTARAILFARLDSRERWVIVAMVTTNVRVQERKVVALARYLDQERFHERRYHRALGRLRREGMIEEDESGYLVLTDPGRWVGRIERKWLDFVDTVDAIRAGMQDVTPGPYRRNGERDDVETGKPLGTSRRSRAAQPR